MPTELDIKVMCEHLRDTLTEINVKNPNVVLAYAMAFDIIATTPYLVSLIKNYQENNF